MFNFSHERYGSVPIPGNRIEEALSPTAVCMLIAQSTAPTNSICASTYSVMNRVDYLRRMYQIW